MKIKKFLFKCFNFIKICFDKIKTFIKRYWKDILGGIFVLIVVQFIFLCGYFYANENKNNDLEVVSTCSNNYNISMFNTVSASESGDISNVVGYNPQFDIIPISNITFYSYYYFKPVSPLLFGNDYVNREYFLMYPIIKNYDTLEIGYQRLDINIGYNEFVVACNSVVNDFDCVAFRVRFYFSKIYDINSTLFENTENYSYSFNLYPYDDTFDTNLQGLYGSANEFDFGWTRFVMINLNNPANQYIDNAITNNYVDAYHIVSYLDNYNVGYNAGLSDGVINNGLFGFLGDSVFNIFSVELFPDFPLYNLFLIGIGLLTFGLLVKLFNW